MNKIILCLDTFRDRWLCTKLTMSQSLKALVLFIDKVRSRKWKSGHAKKEMRLQHERFVGIWHLPASTVVACSESSTG